MKAKRRLLTAAAISAFFTLGTTLVSATPITAQNKNMNKTGSASARTGNTNSRRRGRRHHRRMHRRASKKGSGGTTTPPPK
jgi:hypothetical protein